jgi:hypothetical protein
VSGSMMSVSTCTTAQQSICTRACAQRLARIAVDQCRLGAPGRAWPGAWCHWYKTGSLSTLCKVCTAAAAAWQVLPPLQPCIFNTVLWLCADTMPEGG